jgi:imidazolonepropionase-like amidohydrolase
MRVDVGDLAAHWATEVTKAAHERGIPLTAGTDGISIFDEFETLVNSVGLTPLEVLTSATSVGAVAIGAGADLGTVEEGKVADLVVYRSDPSTNIRN